MYQPTSANLRLRKLLSHLLGGETLRNQVMELVGISTDSYTNHKNVTQPITATAGPSGQPAKKRKILNQPDISNNIKYNVDVSNSYDILSDSDPDSEEELSQSQPKKPKNFKPPPIVVYSYIQNHMKSLNDIKKQLIDEISIKYRGNRIILQTNNRTDYEKIKQLMQKSKLDFHTYTPKEDKDHKLVLKNLPPSITPDEIKASLAEQNIIVKKVTQMIKKIADNTQLPLPLYIITASNELNIKDILKVKKVCYCIITWERYRSKNSITQCFKCQAFDHIAINCFKAPKCVHCAETHLTADCDKNNDENLKCTNCGEKHQANYKNCSVYLKQTSLKLKKNNVLPQYKSNSTNYELRTEDFPKLNPTASASTDSATEMLKDTTWPTQKTQPKETGNESISSILILLKSFLQNLNLSSILQKIKTAIYKIVSAPDNISKLGIILEAVMDLLG